ncbi:MAG: TolC family protein [Puniceicoccaceae bacterium]
MPSDPSAPATRPVHRIPVLFALFGCVWLTSCRSPQEYRGEADETAYGIIAEKQKEGLGETEEFTVEEAAETLRDRLLIGQDLPYSDPASLGTDALDPTEHWPEDDYLDPGREGRPPSAPASEPRDAPLRLSLNEALQVAAGNNRTYQSQKESVFRAALALDLEREVFRTRFSGPLSAGVEGESSSNADSTATATESAGLGVTRRLRRGGALTGRIALDLVQVLTRGGADSLGLIADGSIEIPLLRGAGRWVVAEPLAQAERNALYAIYNFERFKQTFAVDVASGYLGVLRQYDQVDNAGENYRRLVTSSRRARALANQGRLPEIQVDQALQDELRARNGWISARQDYQDGLDNLKILLGLPTDASIELDRRTLDRLAEAVKGVLPALGRGEMENGSGGDVPPADAPIDLEPPDPEDRGPLEMDSEEAIILALANRLDLRVAEGGVYDAMRKVAVAADGFLPEFTLLAGGAFSEERTLGTGSGDNGEVTINRGTYNALLSIDLPFDRTAERDLYRNRLIDLEESVRDLQSLEDDIKLRIRGQLREMLESRESLRIQAQAVTLAERRVDSTGLLLELGRAEIRDVLDAQESLLSAQNALTSALVNYRVSELQLQSNLGLLRIDGDGLWEEYRPESE